MLAMSLQMTNDPLRWQTESQTDTSSSRRHERPWKKIRINKYNVWQTKPNANSLVRACVTDRWQEFMPVCFNILQHLLHLKQCDVLLKLSRLPRSMSPARQLSQSAVTLWIGGFKLQITSESRRTRDAHSYAPALPVPTGAKQTHKHPLAECRRAAPPPRMSASAL